MRVAGVDGAAGRRRSRTATLSLVRTLRNEVAVRPDPLSILRGRVAQAIERRRRGGTRPADRPLRLVQRLPEDLRGTGRRGYPAGRLDVAASRHRRAGAGLATDGRVAVRPRSAGRQRPAIPERLRQSGGVGGPLGRLSLETLAGPRGTGRARRPEGESL